MLMRAKEREVPYVVWVGDRSLDRQIRAVQKHIDRHLLVLRWFHTPYEGENLPPTILSEIVRRFSRCRQRDSASWRFHREADFSSQRGHPGLHELEPITSPL